jgi:hypothetical protein
MKTVRRHFSFFLLLAFFLAVTPPEFLHDLLGHDDTHCRFHADLTLEQRHVHCKILQVQSLKYVNPGEHFSLSPDYFFHKYLFSAISFEPGISVHLASLRAPPSCS